jgi:hypothetical protein
LGPQNAAHRQCQVEITNTAVLRSAGHGGTNLFVVSNPILAIRRIRPIWLKRR